MDFFRRSNRVHVIKKYPDAIAPYFQHRRWQNVTLLEELAGTWHYQSKLKQYSLRFFNSIILFTMILALANKLPEFIGVDLIITIESVVVIIFFFVFITKLIIASAYQLQRKKIYERITEHFRIITDPEEAAALNEYTDRSFKYVVIYIGTVFLCLATYEIVPVLRSLYDYFVVGDKLNIALPLQVDYGFDHKKYWYIVLPLFTFHVYCAVIVDVAFDLSYIMQIWHLRAIFKIVGMRVNKASKIASEDFQNGNEMSNEAMEESHTIITSAIDLHSEGLRLADMIEETYITISWFILGLCNTAFLGAGIHVISASLHDPIKLFRLICAFATITIHFFVTFSQGQFVLDATSSIFDACYDCKWYYMPKKTCKLLNIMMIKASVPCEMTGGKLFTMDIETFGNMFKVGMSYYTIFQN